MTEWERKEFLEIMRKPLAERTAKDFYRGSELLQMQLEELERLKAVRFFTAANTRTEDEKIK